MDKKVEPHQKIESQRVGNNIAGAEGLLGPDDGEAGQRAREVRHVGEVEFVVLRVLRWTL